MIFLIVLRNEFWDNHFPPGQGERAVVRCLRRVYTISSKQEEARRRAEQHGWTEAKTETQGRRGGPVLV